MKLITKCPHCGTQLKVKAFLVEDRLELAEAKGKQFEMQCKNCHKQLMVDVDDVIAEGDLSALLWGSLSLLAAAIAIFYFWDVGISAFFTLAIPLVVVVSSYDNQRAKIRLFNDLYYDSKRLRIP